jgi:Domain of Unknown Function (DUF1206)
MDASHRMTILTRVGFAARGLLYIVIAMLLFQSGRSEDPSGALVELGRSGGDTLLLAMAAGFIGYGLWRLADAWLNIEGHELGAKGIGGRIAAAISGLVYLALAGQAFRLMDGGGGPGPGDEAEQGAQTALALPGGPLLLVLGGAILIGAGSFQLLTAYRCGFCQRLDPIVAQRSWVRWMGRGGYAARGVIFLVTGFFLLRAGFESRPSAAGGIADALRWLESPIDLAVAAGLLLFGLFSLVEARFRIIHDVPLDEVADAIDPRR